MLSGSVFWFLVIYLVSFGVLKLLLKVVPRLKNQKVFVKLQAFMFYGFFIALIVEGYMEFCFSALF